MLDTTLRVVTTATAVSRVNNWMSVIGNDLSLTSVTLHCWWGRRHGTLRFHIARMWYRRKRTQKERERGGRPRKPNSAQMVRSSATALSPSPSPFSCPAYLHCTVMPGMQVWEDTQITRRGSCGSGLPLRWLVTLNGISRTSIDAYTSF